MMFCDCSSCEQVQKCPYKNLYVRLPREYYKGALGLCPKLKLIQNMKDGKNNGKV